MSIPLDRLYHYIESVAKDVYGDSIIYRFYPHGSKKIEDLTPLDQKYTLEELLLHPQIFCNDQEPLNYNLYDSKKYNGISMPAEIIGDHCLLFQDNLRQNLANVFDQCIVMHSEKQSDNVAIYQQNNFVPVYYWSHAFLALDWYRYAFHVDKNLETIPEKTFLIYNRAWTGTREYRLKLAELLVENQLVSCSKTSVKFIENNVHYRQHNFQSNKWKTNITLEDYYNENLTTACFSADFEQSDYNNTLCEIVLETLFDDTRLHLTEKTLRPIAVGHPFILCATSGSLEYLKDYGFRTFADIFDESYDQINNPLERMHAIIKLMKEINNWTQSEKIEKMQKMKKITDFNKERFFSSDFFSQINNELKNNLKLGLETVEKNNTFSRCLTRSKRINSDEKILTWLAHHTTTEQSKAIANAINLAKSNQKKL